MTRLTLWAALMVTSAGITACGSDDATTQDPSGPAAPGTIITEPASLRALSTYEASVGTMVEAYGTAFPETSQGELYLIFVGVFDADDGTKEAVDLEIPVRRVDASTARWTGFGPFRNPLSAAGNKTGEFHGTVAARVLTADGRVLDDPDKTRIDFKVRPSVLVQEFQPVTAACNGPVKRALGGAAYRLRVEAIGFTPKSFTYSLAAPQANLPPVIVRHLASGRYDSVGERGDFTMPPVPDGQQYYSALVSIVAVDDKGDTYSSAFAIGVHRPLEVFYNGNLEVAEVLAPVPVSGCIPGGEAGRAVIYTEAMSETRNRTYNLNWNEQWLDTHTVSAGSQQTIGLSETNGVGFSTTDGQVFNWSLGTEVSGKFDIAGLVQAGVSVNGSVGGERSREQTQSARRDSGVNAATTTTETESASQARGGQVGGGFSWQVSSTQSISKAFGGTVIAGTFGVFYRQTIRMMRRAAVVTYNQCGSASVVANVDFADWTWAPDLALGDRCPPLPQSNLPPAQCTLDPCGGQ